jgi:hypothetical protein
VGPLDELAGRYREPLDATDLTFDQWIYESSDRAMPDYA